MLHLGAFAGLPVCDVMTTALSLRNLTKTYTNGFTALKGIDLDVQEGDFFALLGPNGAGKSTAIGIVASLVNKTGGTVEVFGHDLDTDLAAAKSCLGLVPQEFNFNVFEPVLEIVVNQAGFYGIPRDEASRRAEHCLKQLGLWEKRRAIARSLSGGMKRRLMIARALVHRPRLLILDEPTAGVDIEIRRSMWDFLRCINAEGTTIILTTHYLEEAQALCGRIAMLKNGRIVALDSTKALLRRFATHSLRLRLSNPDVGVALGGVAEDEGGWLVFGFDAMADVETLLRRLREAGAGVEEMTLGEPELEQVFMELMQHA